jgi:hypothetical protein
MITKAIFQREKTGMNTKSITIESPRLSEKVGAFFCYLALTTPETEGHYESSIMGTADVFLKL